MAQSDLYAGWTISIEMDNPFAAVMPEPVYDVTTRRRFEREVRTRIDEAFPGAAVQLQIAWDARTWSRRVRARDPEDRQDAERDAEHRLVQLLERVSARRDLWAA